MSRADKIAIIDIGTNSVLLTIAEKERDGSLTTLAEEARITRIGEGLGLEQRFIPEAMSRTAKVIGEYDKICRSLEVDQIIAVGTAAFRKAVNAGDFIEDVEQRFGISIEVISEEREAELCFIASQNFGNDLLILDIGGGSTDLIWHDHTQDGIKSLSLPLGCVVLHERLVKSDPINDDDFARLQTYIQTELNNVQKLMGVSENTLPQKVPERLVATAGTATTLAAMHLKLETYSHSDVHGTELNEEDIADFIRQLRDATVEERKKIPGIEPARADVILEGAMVLDETMKLFSYDIVTISDRGVRWGIIYEMC